MLESALGDENVTSKQIDDKWLFILTCLLPMLNIALALWEVRTYRKIMMEVHDGTPRASTVSTAEKW